jgi:hypothetical protein
MSSQTNAKSDFLNEIGLAILTLDTRWVILAAIVFVGLYIVVHRWKKKRFMRQDDAVSLGLTLLQLYSAPVLISMLVLTQPPAIDLVGTFQRQSAGALAFIFLIGGVLTQIKRFWTNEPNPEQDKKKPSAEEAAKSGNGAQ